MTLLAPVAIALTLLPSIHVQAVVSATATISGSTTSTDSAAASSNSTDCSYNGNVGDYLSCEKNKISTVTLIGSGIGITVGIFVLAFGCIWLTRKKRRAVAKSHNADDGELGEVEEVEMDGEGEGTGEKKKKRKPKKKEIYTSDEEELVPVRLREDDPSVPSRANAEPPRRPSAAAATLQGHRDPRVTTVEDADSSSSEMDPLPRGAPRKGSRDTLYSQKSGMRPHQQQHQAGAQPMPIDPRSGSPVQSTNVRNLYPSNPSPNPRYLQAQAAGLPPPQYQTQHQQQPAYPSANLAAQASRASRASVLSSYSTYSTRGPGPARQASPPLPSAMRASTHGRQVPLRSGGPSAAGRPTSSASFARRGEPGGDIPPLPTQNPARQLTGQGQVGRPPARPPTRIIRAESDTPAPAPPPEGAPPPVPTASSLPAVPTLATLPLPPVLGEEPPERKGSTSPLNIKKSVPQSNFIPSYYQSTSDAPSPTDTTATTITAPPSYETVPSLPRSHAPSVGPSASRKPSVPGGYTKLDSGSSGSERVSGSERASSGSEGLGPIPAIPPFKGNPSSSGSVGTKQNQTQGGGRRPSAGGRQQSASGGRQVRRPSEAGGMI
ncbi:hypothetical protein IAT38_002537 [Cryptococcus sp. DSM 104549]